jgi:hypothetical protein
MIVVDLGCADHGEAFSLRQLVDRYAPDRIFGFDPSPTLEESVDIRRSAAWLFDGEIGYTEDGIRSAIGEGQPVPCFDFSTWLQGVGNAVVKMDVEGAEASLLERMIVDGADKLVTELLVEWHNPGDAERLLPQLRCPVTDWWM